MKSVTHVITTIERGGAENQLLTLVEQQVKMGLVVSIVFLKGKPELEEAFKKIQVKEIYSLNGKTLIGQIHQLRKLLHGETNVHAHLPRAELLTRLAIPNKSNFIVSRHNAEQFFPGSPRFLSSVLSKFVVSRSRFVIAISHAVEDFLISNREVLGHKKVLVIYYGRANINRNQQSVGSNSKLIGTVARLTEQKDYPTLLKSFQIFHSENPNYRLQIVGVGHLEDHLKQLCAELGIAPFVDWIGKVSDPAEYLKNWDIFVLTSLYEGFGLVLLEAMSLKVPIVASNNSAIPEVLGSDYIGLAQTSSPEDFSRKYSLLLNKLNREAAQDQLEKSLFRFDPEIMAKEVSKLYV
jgi:glycosyltransferase involved in cell wall biosynthesis